MGLGFNTIPELRCALQSSSIIIRNKKDNIFVRNREIIRILELLITFQDISITDSKAGNLD